VAKVDAGGRLVDEAGTTMQEIVDGITRVTDIMSEIASASAEQTVGIEQVNEAITQMDSVTQQNAALVEEAAAAAGSLQEQAAALAQIVSVFKVGDENAVRSVRRAPAGGALVVRTPASRRVERTSQVEVEEDAIA
ncbi:methyl-accepting chemotaxis protein, partial [Massilia aurea]|uniref:methyl-accepting chemotaxis protein n=1 Tax=Massilia aurea TaxID=373040 RepID=UPI001E4DB53A